MRVGRIPLVVELSPPPLGPMGVVGRVLFLGSGEGQRWAPAIQSDVHCSHLQRNGQGNGQPTW